jgi:hypothetical protein
VTHDAIIHDGQRRRVVESKHITNSFCMNTLGSSPTHSNIPMNESTFNENLKKDAFLVVFLNQTLTVRDLLSIASTSKALLGIADQVSLW